MRPVIAIPQWGNQPFRLYMKSKYIQSLRRANAKLCWLEMNDPHLAEKTAACDGLLLPGGDDIEPSRYGQARSEQCGKSSELRDCAEWTMLAAFLPTQKPILCICRGVQFLNVFCGGTLHQHIPNHSDFRSRAKGCHNVHITEDSLLFNLVQTDTLFVNSLHHQAADAIAPNLRVTAVSDDGIAEALELQNHPFCLGVQWHPEHLSKTRADQQKLFDAFVEACKK